MTMQSAQERAIEKVRPLTATQTRNLEKLVKEDFRVLEEDIRMKAARARYEEVEAARAAADPERQAELKQEVYDILSEAKEKLREVAARCSALGLSVGLPSMSSGNVSFSDNELSNKIRSIERRAAQELDLALSLMRREQSKVQRQVLIASITAQTEDVLNSLPSAEELYAKAIEELADRNTDAEARSRVFHKGQWMDRSFAISQGYKGP